MHAIRMGTPQLGEPTPLQVNRQWEYLAQREEYWQQHSGTYDAEKCSPGMHAIRMGTPQLGLSSVGVCVVGSSSPTASPSSSRPNAAACSRLLKAEILEARRGREAAEVELARLRAELACSNGKQSGT